MYGRRMTAIPFITGEAERTVFDAIPCDFKGSVAKLTYIHLTHN